jgi:hypothetical protein
MADFAEAIKSELKPDAAQQKRIDEILASARGRFAQAMGGGEAAARGERLREIRQEIAREVESTLSEAQKPLFAALSQRLAAQRGGPGGRGGATGQPGRVFVPGADGAPQAVALTLGASDGTVTEVLSGSLAEGQEAIVGGGAAKPASSLLGRFF